jgi:hypothetical protein
MATFSNEGFTQQIVACTPDGVIFADRDGVIRFWNAGAQAIFGYSAQEAVGQPLALIIPERLRYDLADKPKSDLYRDLLPLVNSGQVELLDYPKLVTQLCSLERRTARGGRDSIDHPPHAHDDIVNAAAGALLAARQRTRGKVFIDNAEGAVSPPDVNPNSVVHQLRQVFPGMSEKPSGLRCGACVHRTTNNAARGSDDPYCSMHRFFIEDTSTTCSWFDPASR